MIRETHIDWLTALACGVLAVAFVMRFQLLGGLSETTIDPFDGTIELALLEHWSNVLRGQAAWHTPLYFHPHAGTLAYNDGYLLFGLVHATFRALGADILVSAELTHGIFRLIAFLGLFGLLRIGLLASRTASLFGAALFSLGSSFVIHGGHHAQLLSIGLAPCLGLLLALAYRTARLGHAWTAFGWSCTAVLLLGTWLLTGFYAAWFTLFFGLLFLPAWLVVAGRTERGAALAALRGFGAMRLGGVVLLTLAAVVPFLWLYLPKAAATGTWHPRMIVHHLPRLADIVNVGPDALLLGSLMAHLQEVLPQTFARDLERVSGLSPLLVVIVAAVSMIWIWRVADFPGRTVLRAAVIAGVVSWALTLKIGNVSLWPAVFWTIPGASAIRVVARYQLFLAVPVAILTAVFLDRLARGGRPALAFAIAAPLLLLQPAGRALLIPAGAHPVRSAADLPPVAPACRAFYTTGEVPPGLGLIGRLYPHNVAAMLVSNVVALPTINGISTFNPPDWAFGDADRPEYQGRVWLYGRDHRLDGLCALDVPTRAWTEKPLPPRDAAPADALIATWFGPTELGRTEAFHLGAAAARWLGPGWSSPEPWGVWSEGPFASIVLPFRPEALAGRRLAVRALGFPQPGGKPRTVSLRVDDGPPSRLELGPQPCDHIVILPAVLRPLPQLRFEIERPTRPAELAMSADGRRLGLGLISLRIEPAAVAGETPGDRGADAPQAPACAEDRR